MSLAVLLLASCGRPPADDVAELEQAIDTPRICTKDLAALRTMKEDDSGASCQRDIDCPCGSYCEMLGAIGRCTLVCLTETDPDYGCDSGLTCDTWGQCTTPNTSPPSDTYTFVQSVDPVVVTLPETIPSAGFTPTLIDIELKTEAATAPPIATLPTVTLAGGTDADIGCVDDLPSTPCPPGNHPVVDVSCLPGTFGAKCEIPGDAWALKRQGPGHAAGKTEYVFGTSAQARPRSSASLATAPWTVYVEADRGTSNNEGTITFVPARTQPVAGHYVGELVLTENPWRTTPTTEGNQVRVPVEAYVVSLDRPIFVSDPARLISPSGGIRVGVLGGAPQQPPGSSFTAAVASPSVPPPPPNSPPVMQLFNSIDTGTGAVRAAMRTDAITRDAQTGRLSVDVSVNLNNSRAWKWRFDLRRTDGDVRSCESDTGCRTEEQCEPEIKRCVPKAPWTATATSSTDLASLGNEPTQPTAGWRAFAALAINASSALSVQRSGDDLERLMCTARIPCTPSSSCPAGSSWSIDHLGDHVDDVSADLGCTGGDVPFIGRAIQQQSVVLEQMLTYCMNELNADAPTSASAVDFSDSNATTCISRARFLAAVGGPNVLTRFAEPRAGRLFLHLLGQWARTHAFVAKQAIEIWMHDAVNQPPISDPIEPYMSAVRKGWLLLLDPEIRRAVLVAARFDRKPDYRREMFPALFWQGQAMDDIVRHLHVTQSWLFNTIGFGTGTLGPDDVDLSGSVSVMFSAGYDTIRPTLRYLFEGGGLSVRMLRRGRPAYDIDTRIKVTNGKPTFTPFTDDTWSNCWQRCVQATSNLRDCAAWDYDGSTRQCRIFSGVEWMPGASEPTKEIPYWPAREGFTHDDTKPRMSGVLDPRALPDPIHPVVLERTLTANDVVTGTVTVDASRAPNAAAGQAWCRGLCEVAGNVTCTQSTYEHATRRCQFHNEIPTYVTAATGNYTHLLPAMAQLITGIDSFAKRGVDAGGTTIRILSSIDKWSTCYDRCSTDASCKGWSFNRVARTCRLTTAEGTAVQTASIEGGTPEIVLTVEHMAKGGVKVAHDIVLEHGRHWMDPRTTFAITRDNLEKKYRVYRNGVLIDSWSYTDEQSPIPRTGDIKIDRNPGANTEVASNLAIWTTALDSDRIAQLQSSNTLSSGPTPDELDDPDHSLGLPVHLLEGIESYMDLTAEVARQKLSGALATCTAGHSTPEQRDALLGIGEAVRISFAVEDLAAAAYQQAQVVRCFDDVACAPFGGTCNRATKPSAAERETWGTCVGSDGLTLRVNPPWEKQYRDASALVEAARAEAIRNTRALVNCQNPLGVSDDDLPLYFDPQDVTYFASSTFLIRKAGDAIDLATSKLNLARAHWLQLVTAAMNQPVDNPNARAAQVSRSYDGDLSRLCGDRGEDMRTKFETHVLAPESCFISGDDCNGKSIKDAPATCFHGELGEAVLAMKASEAALATRQQAVTDKTREIENQSYVCALIVEEQQMLIEHYKQMNLLHMANGVLGLMTKVMELSSTSSALSAAALLAHTANFGGDSAGLSQYEDLTADSASSKLAAGALGILGSAFSTYIDSEESQFNHRLTLHQENTKLVECNNVVDKLHGELRTAQGNLVEETALYEQAALRLGNGVRTVESIVRRGTATVARERAARFVKPEHHMWLDSEVDAYKKSLKQAIRLTYLAMRAAEYEHQMSFGVRGRILGARTPEDLDDALDTLNTVQNTGKLCGVPPVTNYFVVKLSALMGIADPGLSMTTEERARFRAQLGARASWFVDDHGKVLGHAVRFVLTPDVGNTWIDPNLSSMLHYRAGERIHSVALVAAGAGENGSPPIAGSHQITIYHANTFASQWCVDNQHEAPFQVSSIRPQKNLLVDPAGGALGDDQTPFTRADIAATASVPAGFMDSKSWSSGEADNSLRGRGLYGEYWLLIPGDNGIDINRLDEILIRFDYDSAAKQ